MSSSAHASASTLQPTAFPEIETWVNHYPERVFTITIAVPEFTSVCPKTGLPDFGVITIHYIPDQTCVELKAFKYYMLAYRNHGIFYESVVNKVLDDIVAACDPRYIEVTGDFSSRGGITTMVKAKHRKPGFELPVSD